jgi:tetratricopeptide (TPR) repeat protein
MAAKERQLNQYVAATWFAEGEQQLAQGNTRKAIESLRRATSSDYDNRDYSLALARALATVGRDEEARYALLRLRDAAPENAEVNLDLARIAAKHADVAEASHYYHNALYGLWTGTEVDRQQRQVRMELIRFLLDHQKRSAALSELLILESDLPDDADTQTQVAQLFLNADDADHAIKHFRSALRVDKHDPLALSGAGEAAFRLGDYAQARHYLEGAVAVGEKGPAQESLALTKMILSSDPLTPHLPTEERGRRLKVGFDQAFATLESCQSQSGGPSDLDALHSEAAAMKPQIKTHAQRPDPETLESGVDLIAKMEEAVSNRCGEPQGLDHALLLIGRKYRGAMP